MARIFPFPSNALRTRVTLMMPVDMPDGAGGQMRGWVNMGQRWAQIIVSSGNGTKAPKNPRLQAVIRQGALTVQMPLRLQWRGQTYKVTQLIDVIEQGVLQLTCELVS